MDREYQETGFVTAYYRNPKTGKTEMHRLTSITWEEATSPVPVGDGSNHVRQVTHDEKALWSREPPKDEEIVDMTPGSFEELLQHSIQSAPPPSVASRPISSRMGPRSDARIAASRMTATGRRIGA